MTVRAHLLRSTIVASALVFGAAPPALAQDQTPSQGPLQLLPIENRVIFAPDVKITQINGATGELVGAYGGIEIDNHFFLGGAGYWLAEADHKADMFYVGALLGWQFVNTERFHIGGRGLVGFGEATAYDTAYPVDVTPHHGGYYPGHGYGYGYGYGAWYSAMVIAEPEVRAEIGVSHQIRIGLGLGYRVTSAENFYGRQLNGVTGSVSVQIGLGK
jgi:hypothetical protein